MSRVKDIVIKIIPVQIARDFIVKNHYSNKFVSNSILNFGCFLDDKLHGVLQYGHSMQKKNSLSVVKNTGWNEFLELNRMAFDNYLPRNSESYCIGKTLRMIKKNAPHIKWVISYADGTLCGDGTIYRATNFVLTDIRKNQSVFLDINTNKTLHKVVMDRKRISRDGTRYKLLQGNQFRYIYFIDRKFIKNLTVPIIPFSKIDELNVGMYKGERISIKERNKDLKGYEN